MIKSNEQILKELNEVLKTNCIVKFSRFFSSIPDKKSNEVILLSPTIAPWAFIENNDFEGFKKSLLNSEIQPCLVFSFSIEYAIYKNLSLKYIELLYNHPKMQENFDYITSFEILLNNNNISVLCFLFNQPSVRKQLKKNEDLYKLVFEKVKLKNIIDSF